MPKAELLVEYEKAISLLEEKKAKIDGMILTLEVLKTAVAAGIKEVSLNVDTSESKFPEGMSFLAKLRIVTNQLNKISGQIGLPHLRFMISFIMLCKVFSSCENEEKIRSNIDQVYEYGKIYIPDEYEDPEDLTDDEKRDGVTEYIEDILQAAEGIKMIDEAFGEGTATGLMDLIHSYKGVPERDDEVGPEDDDGAEAAENAP